MEDNKGDTVYTGVPLTIQSEEVVIETGVPLPLPRRLQHNEDITVDGDNATETAPREDSASCVLLDIVLKALFLVVGAVVGQSLCVLLHSHPPHDDLSTKNNLVAFTEVMAQNEARLAMQEVRVLTEHKFNGFLAQNSHVFVAFTVPWCQWSQRLAPTWASFAKEIEEEGVQVVNVDCMDQAELCSLHGVIAYPTLRWFGFGKNRKSDYNGDHSMDALMGYARNQTAAVEPQMLTLHQFDNFIAHNSHVFVAFIAPWCPWSQRLVPTWASFAKEIEEEGVQVVKVDCMDQMELCRLQGVMSFPTLRWFEFGQSRKSDYNGDHSMDALMGFARNQAWLPHV